MAFVGGASSRTTALRSNSTAARCCVKRDAEYRARRGSGRRANVVSMVAAENVKDVELNTRALRNLSFVRGQRSIFCATKGFSALDAALCRKNDTARSYISDEQIQYAKGAKGGAIHKMIRDNAPEIVEATMQKLASKHSEAMSMPTVRKNVQVDVEWFLRVTSYGVACEQTSFLNMESLALYPDIYENFGLGVPFLIELVDELKKATAYFTKKPIEPYFDSFRKALETML